MQQKIANEHSKLFEVHIEDMEETLRKEEDREILERVKTNVKRYVEMIYEIVEKNMPVRNIEINPEDVTNPSRSVSAMNSKTPSKSKDGKTWWATTRTMSQKTR